MPQYAPVLELSLLDGTDGFRLNGAAAGDLSGIRVDGAGDFNGDGFADLIVGALYADPNGTSSGASYIVFGAAGGFAASIELSGLDGADGFRLNGDAINDYTSLVSSAGDINGDGFDDVVIGGEGDPNGNASGASYIVFGAAGGFAASLELSALDGADGFQVNGEAADDIAASVAAAGDVNGDGFDDLLIGAFGADPNGLFSGASYVVFGAAGGFAAAFELSGLDGSDGFQINGEAADDRSGLTVASAGDINNDGFADIIIGALFADPNGLSSGASYVLFGQAGGFAASLELSGLDGSDGFQINGELAGDQAGRSVASAGDVNADGFADLIIGARFADPNGTSSGASYVVLGQAGGFAATLELSGLDGSDGFQINGELAGDGAGLVASAGDFNGDGFDDLIIGALAADPNGMSSGASYVVFGAAGGFAATIELSALDGNDGFQINGAAADDLSGGAVASAGDVNGDGFADLIIGAVYADPNGANSGASYVIFGGRPGEAVTRAGTAIGNTIFGSAFADTLNGLGGDDVLDGGAGADAMNGGLGDDLLISGAGDDAMNGGAGSDTVRYLAAAGGIAITLGAGADLDGDGGTDTLIAIENVIGSAFADSITGSGAVNAFDGGAGADIMNGLGGADVIIGGDGDDELTGNTGTDTISGGEGDDTLRGGSAGDALDGGIGIDTATYTASTIRVIVDLGAATTAGGEAAGDALVSIENLLGSAFNDELTGSAVANTFNGGDGDDTLSGGDDADTLLGAAGNDVLEGGAGVDVLTGGAGSDTASYASSSAAVSVHLASGVVSGGDADGDVLAQIEGVTGSAFDDVLTGSAGANAIVGGAGADTLLGGFGIDTLTGGLGADLFVFNVIGLSNMDAITDFSVAQDTMHVENAVFTGLALGALAAGAFRIAAGAVDADDRIIYQSGSGALFFDADGNGGGAQFQFATLAPGLALTAADFVVI